MHSLGEATTDAEIEAIMKGVDANKDGTIDFDEFLSLMSRRSKVTGAEMEEDELRHVFKVFDKDGNGTINLEELKTVMRNLGERLSDEECRLMIKAADADGNGVIDFDGMFYLHTRPSPAEADYLMCQNFVV